MEACSLWPKRRKAIDQRAVESVLDEMCGAHERGAREVPAKKKAAKKAAPKKAAKKKAAKKK
jgi:hypothetical protein